MAVEVKGNLNKFHDQVSNDVSKLIAGAAVDGAVIFNDTTAPVTFFTYNYIDTVYWVAAQRVLVAPERYGTVAASGKFFKIHPNDNKDEEFLVEPGRAYVYHGPGNLEAAK